VFCGAAQAPLGTYLGWNVTASGFNQGKVCNYQGGRIPFAKTQAERSQQRPALVARSYRHNQGGVRSLTS
jgi:hypothetical protein